MIPLIPYKRILITTSLTINDAVAVLAKAVSPKKRWYQWSFGGGGFEGIVSRDGFKIERTISYCNSFLPIHAWHIPTSRQWYTDRRYNENASACDRVLDFLV
jgi:hypothetical protein